MTRPNPLSKSPEHDPHAGFRSPLLMERHDTALVVIDVQSKLLPHIQNHEQVSWNITRLLRGANELGVAVCATEQYPKGLGSTVEPVAYHFESLIGNSVPEKLMFSCRECSALFEHDEMKKRNKLLVCGIESHVCILQSVLDFISSGFFVYVCVDAVGSRFTKDHETALRRMESSGATLVTTEMALFEWCEVAGTPEFKKISKLAQETSAKSTAARETADIKNDAEKESDNSDTADSN